MSSVSVHRRRVVGIVSVAVAVLRVVAADNRTLSGAAALRRTLASLVSVVTGGLGYLPGLVGRDRRAIHDRLAGSRVVTAGAA